MRPELKQLQGRPVDVQDPETVEIKIDGDRLWVNVGPICVFRAIGVETLIIDSKWMDVERALQNLKIVRGGV